MCGPQALPPEIWLRIFSLLQARELTSVVGVCRFWASVASLPHLWAKVRLSKRKLLMEGFHHLFSVPRFSSLRTLDYSRAWLKHQGWREVLEQVIMCGQVHHLDLSQAKLHDVGTELVAEAVSRVTRVTLSNVQGLDLPHLILRACSPSSRLRHLTLEEVNLPGNTGLEGVEAGVLARALATLHTIELAEASLLSRDQLAVLLDTCSRSGTKVSGVVSTEEEPLLPRLLPYMDRATVQVGSSWHLSPHLWTSLLSPLSLPSSRLSHLDLEGVSLSLAGVEPRLLAHLSSLSSLRLSGLHLSPPQWSSLLLSLPPSTLTTGLSRLSSLSLQFAALSPHQWEALLPSLSSSPTLHSLALVQVDLSPLPPHLLPPLVRRLEHLDLSDSRLSPLHLQPLLAAVPSSNLRCLGLAGQDLAQVGREVLARGVASLHRVVLRKAKLGEEQVRALLSCCLGPCRLRQIDLSCVNLSSIPGDLLALAVSRLREADLTCTWLTRAQLAAMVDQVCRYTRLEHLRLQAATVALLTREMRRRLEGELYLSVF